MIKNLTQIISSHAQTSPSDVVDFAHEYLRRKVENGVVEQWYYVRSELSKLLQQNNDNGKLKEHIDTVLENTADHKWYVRYFC